MGRKAKVVHYGKSPAHSVVLEGGEIRIAAWCPDAQALKPPEQVHLSFKIAGIDGAVTMRFKSPDTLGTVIEQLANYRRYVWPDAEPLELEAKDG